MSSSNDKPESERDEERLAALLRWAGAEALPPNAEALAALRARSLEAFVESGSGSDGPLANASSNAALLGKPAVAPVSPAAAADADDASSAFPIPDPRSPIPDGPSPVAQQQPRKNMYTLAIRGLLALAASIAAIATWMNYSGPAPAHGASLGDVLAEMRSAKSLELRLVKEGREADVLIAAPGLVRYQETPTEYKIAAGSRLWQIDEKTNTVKELDSPWFVSPTDQVDLVALLGVGVTDSSPLLTAQPGEKTQYAGRLCQTYRAELPTKNRLVEISAYADAKTLQLVGITARGAGDKPSGPPLAELQLVAMNAPVDETKFAVAKSLSDDGRIGKVVDAQGIVVLRPLLAQRWTLVAQGMPLKTGDWLRTDVRGANAVRVRMTSGVELTLGPASLVELISPTQARLHVGEAQVKTPDSKKKEEAAAPAFELLAPRAGSKSFAGAGKTILLVDREEKLVEIKTTPQWLSSFEGASANESLGSLIVKVDGRDEPLAVGEHKVKVEIRDQIARTTIEETFVNSTNNRLEGVFHFPLPADASISGFGMWIGSDLVEADIVEKQRAREIYETILRERRDPGLLEWTSGNLFKARVFPIEPNSEKRIKIVYTQVLPLRANRFRYTYALRSELLRTKPLRDLSLSVTVNSAMPLKSVTCPTHSARVTQASNSAQVDFAAQEYSPERDFEVLCELDSGQSDVVVVPHRRGSDGYLLVQLTPPSPAGNWQRELLPEGQPLSVVLLCDTSGSMDAEKRKQQGEFVSTVLASLGEKDRFMLAATDVSTAWLANEPQAPSAENAAKSSKFLTDRVSLGWTNLDQAFDTALRKAPRGAQIIYIGDGIVTSGDRSGPAFVRRLAKMLADKAAEGKAGGDKGAEDKDAAPAWTLHAVSVGQTSEASVLKGIATVGHGSTRAISGDQTPQVVAREWLNEIAQPGLTDLQVEFRGVKVAAMYPERLPNLPAGTQQILVGRYLPEGKDQEGQILVSGKRGKENVRFAAKIDFKDAEEGNSFIPRLWARSQLDYLLDQGGSAAVRDDIIALSEEFHIITPFTSLLVLDSDADRERFGVKRRFEMRDGERFFAQGKANADFELAQQQIKRARDWQLGLRRRILAQLATVGRNPRLFQSPQRRLHGWSEGRMSTMLGRLEERGLEPAEVLSVDAATALPSGGVTDLAARYKTPDMDLYSESGPEGYITLSDSTTLGDGERDQDSAEGLGMAGEKMPPDSTLDDAPEAKDEADLQERGAGVDGLALGPANMPGPAEEFDQTRVPMGESEFAFTDGSVRTLGYDIDGPVAGKPGYGFGGFYGRHYQSYANYTSWLNTLFPSLGPPPAKPLKPKPPARWSAEGIELSKSLSRLEALRKLAGGLEIRSTAESLDPIWKRTSSHNSLLTLYSPDAWLTKPENRDEQTIVNYCDKQERGVYSISFGLGRKRAAHERDLSQPPLALSDWSSTPPHETFAGYRARVEKAGENQAWLILSQVGSTYEFRSLIDTAKHVVLKQETFSEGKRTGVTTFSDFVEAGGSWWATKITATDEKDRKVSQTTIEVKQLAKDAYAERMKSELTDRASVQFMSLPLPRLAVARQHIADGAATFDDRLVMVLSNCQTQQWDEVDKQLTAAEKLAADKPGVRWLRILINRTRGKSEEARLALIKEAKQLAAKPTADEAYLAESIASEASGIAGPDELLEMLATLKPVYDRQPADSELHRSRLNRLAQLYAQLQRTEDALALRRQLADEAPWDINSQTVYARQLLEAGHIEEAYAWLDKQLGRPEERSASDDEALRTSYADLYRTQSRWADLLKFTTAWMARKPETESPYGQHLEALIYNDQLAAAEALVRDWFKQGRVEGTIPADARARLDAALSFAEGRAHNLSLYREWPKWLGEIGETVRFFIRQPKRLDLVNQAASFYQLNNSDEGDRLRAFFLRLLQTDSDKLTPDQINFLVPRVIAGRLEFAEPVNGQRQLDSAELPAEVWKKIAQAIRARWEKATDDDGADDGNEAKHTLGEALKSLYSAKLPDELLPFERDRVKSASADYKPVYLSELFQTLLTQNWTDKIEVKALAVLHQLAGADSEFNLAVQVPALHQFDNAMLSRRQASDEQQLQDHGGLDKLTRPELAAKRAKFRRDALAGLSKRLDDEIKRAVEQKDPLADWLRMEQGWLAIELNRAIDKDADAETKAALQKQIEAYRVFCWTKLGETPPKPDDAKFDDDTPPEKIRQALFDAALRQRALTSVMYLATRPTADPHTIEQLTKYLDAGIAQAGDAAGYWRQTKFQLLVALDRTTQLEQELSAWIRDDKSLAPWRKTLALVVAELGKLDEAARLFESAEKDQLLTAGDYRTLAGWYLALNRREDFERARYQSYAQLPENYLARIIYTAQSRCLNGSSEAHPFEVDDNLLLAFRAIFEKSGSPSNYFSELRNIYAATRDFRVLQVLPDSLLGGTPEHVYNFLQGLQSNVLNELRNEATADEILKRIGELRKRDLSATDRRALDLLEAMIERQASEVQNQREPHVVACLAAMRRAFERKWAPNEPRLMAELLGSFGFMPDERLRTEQLHEFTELAKLAPAGSRDHLIIVAAHAQLLFRSHNRLPDALPLMEAEYHSYDQANQGHWPFEDDQYLSNYLSMLEESGRFVTGEQILQRYLAGAPGEQQTSWLNTRLWVLYNSALERSGSVSLGSGRELFGALVRYGERRLTDAADENEREGCSGQFVQTLMIADRLGLPGAKRAIYKFAFETIPAILPKQESRYTNMATAPTTLVRDALGRRAALEYIVERMEHWPQRLEVTQYNAWQAFAYLLGEERQPGLAERPSLLESEMQKQAPPLEPRVLKLVVAELKTYLLTGETANYSIYYGNNAQFWSEKRADFIAAAEEVYRDSKTSGRRVMTIAQYLYGGLDAYDRAIEMLLVANQGGVLDRGGRQTLASYLQAQNRFAESIAVLEPLVKELPDDMNLRTMLMRAYFHANRAEQLANLVAATDKHFHEGGRWVDNSIAQFGSAALDCRLLDKAAGYLNEAISLHERQHPRTMSADGVLSVWYQQLARTESQRHKTIEAVDAACGAIDCWGPLYQQRAEALATLREVLRESTDLDAFVKHWDEETAKSKQDSALLRKSIGQVYLDSGKSEKAVAQLKLARDLQANDKDIYKQLIRAYDALKQPQAATDALLALVDLDPHDLELQKQLAGRFKEDEAQAERAATNIVEVGATEAENHQALAELRQTQQRWGEAIDQWRDVAELRRLEPTGLIKLIEALIHERRWQDARESLNKLTTTEWPSRFGNVPADAERLRQAIGK